MTGRLRPLAKARNREDLSSTDYQWAAELAFCDARSELNWSIAEMMRRFGKDPKTIRRWLSGETPVDLWKIESVREFADVWWPHYEARKAEIRRMAERKAA